LPILGQSFGVINAKLHRVVVDVEPATEELDVTHSQGHRFTPPDSGVGECEHQGAVLP
jgi:hypothetical protein